MRSIFYSLVMVFVVLFFCTQKCGAQANTSLSNLAATSVNVDLLPGADNVHNLGSATKGWKQLYIDNAVFLGGSKFISFGNTLGLGITAVGNNALAVNSGGFANTGIGFYSLAANTNGNANAAIGTRSLQANTTGSANMAMGYFSLYSNRTGYSNVAIGVRAMLSSTNDHNQVAIGDSALFTTNGGAGFNTAIGSKAMYSNTTGSFNTANGFQSLFANMGGQYNTAIGYQTLYTNTNGFNNTAIGVSSLRSNTVGGSNTSVGYNSMYTNVDGTQNTSIGESSLYANTGGVGNAAVGFNSLKNNTGGGFYFALGYKSLENNTTGSENIAIGNYSLRVNTIGYANVAIGTNALYGNTTGTYNSATGYMSLSYNTTGGYNTANGYSSLLFNTTGGYNTAVGYSALWANLSGGYNTAVGQNSLVGNSTGEDNTAVGSYALQSNGTGSGITALGTNSDITDDGTTNSTVLGYGAIATASNQVTLGNSSVLVVRGAAAYTTYSDGRFKKDIKANVPGLEFIKELRPVTYHYNIHGINDYTKPTPKQNNPRGAGPDRNTPRAWEEDAITAKEKKLYTGFVAQEVEKAADKFNYDFSGLYKPQNEKDLYGLSYSDFVVPLVKGMQELSDSNDAKTAKINSQKDEIDSLKIRLKRLEDMILGQNSISGVSLSDASLSQNMPNPFSGSTNISYSIPQNAGRARLTVTDISGRIIKTVMINGASRGNLNIDASGLSSGVYNYTLYVDEKMVSTKQMVLTK